MVYPNDGEPLILRIHAALRANLEAIASPGYHTDVAHVAWEEVGIEHGLDTPLIAVIPLGRPNHIRGLGAVTKRQLYAVGMCLRIEGDSAGAPNDTWSTELEWFLADVGHAIRTDDQLGGLAFTVQVLEEVAPPRAHSTLAWAECQVAVDFHESYLNPATTC